jgi:hypothetical protein
MAEEQSRGAASGRPALNFERIYGTTVSADEVARALADHKEFGQESGRVFALGLQFGRADGQSRSSRLESWGSLGHLVAPQSVAHVMARAQRAVTQKMAA